MTNIPKPLIDALDDEQEAAMERIFSDARVQAANPNPLYDGRSLEDIDDDIESLRSVLDMEI